MRILLVKMSSLGDVVHALPGVSDAAAILGAETTFDWVVEEAFAAIPARHPSVSEVIPVAWRRWRRNLPAGCADMRAFAGRLRQRRYDVVLDAQGLVKSAVVTALARGRIKAGLSRASAREGMASLAYQRQVAVPREHHAIDRIRALFAGALGYRPPAGPPEYGIRRAPAATRPPARPRCLLLHGTTWESKLWPVPFWREIAERAAREGYEVAVPWGSEEERVRARQMVDGTSAGLLDRRPLADLVEELSTAAVVVGVDSGLAHLAAALEVPTVVIYGSTSSALTGVRGSRVRNLQADFACSPCLSRVCRYQGPERTWQGERVVPACYATVTPDVVWAAAVALTSRPGNADRLLHF